MYLYILSQTFGKSFSDEIQIYFSLYAMFSQSYYIFFSKFYGVVIQAWEDNLQIKYR
jgi:hypothetical protein